MILPLALRAVTTVRQPAEGLSERLRGVNMKAIPCEIVFNTKWGYCIQPVKCKSIREGLRLAKEIGMAFRIFVGNKCVKSGWY